MNIQQIVKNQQLKKSLQSRKQQRIKRKLIAKQRQKTNLDQSDIKIKKGNIQKTKIIQKKKFKTVVQKPKKLKVEIQSNCNAGTFVSETRQYLQILKRTQNYVKFDNKLQQGCTAISAYAQAHKQQLIQLQLTLQKDIQCNQTPILLKIPHLHTQSKNRPSFSLIITNQKQQIEKNAPANVNTRIMDFKQFIAKFKSDKKFKKQVTNKSNRIFCEFKMYAKTGIFRKLIKNNIVVFPLDEKKLPFNLQQQFNSYKQYLSLLLNSQYFIAKSGNKHRIWIKNINDTQKLIENIKSIVHQMVARLIHKNKYRQGEGQQNKGNKLVSVKVKTQSSITIDLYA